MTWPCDANGSRLILSYNYDRIGTQKYLRFLILTSRNDTLFSNAWNEIRVHEWFERLLDISKSSHHHLLLLSLSIIRHGVVLRVHVTLRLGFNFFVGLAKFALNFGPHISNTRWCTTVFDWQEVLKGISRRRRWSSSAEISVGKTFCCSSSKIGTEKKFVASLKGALLSRSREMPSTSQQQTDN